MASYDLTKPLFIAAATAPSVLSGMILSISLLGVPMLLQNDSEANTLHQWRCLFTLGKNTAPPFALVSAVATAGAGYLHYHPQATYRTWLFAASALATMSIAPFTVLAMEPTNRLLHSRESTARAAHSKDGTVETTDETKGLIKRWRNLNAIRALLPLIGSLLAFEAL